MVFQGRIKRLAFQRFSGFLPFLFKVKAFFQFQHRVVCPEISPGHAVPLLQLVPQFGEMTVQLPQLRKGLQRTAPAGDTVENLIQPIPVEAVVIAILKALRLRNIPIDQRMAMIGVLVVFALHAVTFIRGDPHILDHRVCFPQLPQVPLSRFVLQPFRTPAHLRPRPTVTQVVCTVLFRKSGAAFAADTMLAEEILVGVFCPDAGNRSADILFQLVQISSLR